MFDPEVNAWEETKVSDATKGIPPRHLNEFIASLKHSFHFLNQDLLEKFSKTIEQLALDCDDRGLTSTIYGDLDKRTCINAFIHCVKGDDDSVSVYYTVHTLSFQRARKWVMPDFLVRSGFALFNEKNRTPAVGSAIKAFEDMGIHLDSNEKEGSAF